MLGAFAFRGKAPAAVEPVHRAVERPVGAPQVGRHEVGVIEFGQRGVRMGGAGVEDCLSDGFQLVVVGAAVRHREGVVDQSDRIAVVALEPASDVT